MAPSHVRVAARIHAMQRERSQSTSGQTGGLENHGPLKAVVNRWPPKRWRPLEHLQLVKAFIFDLLFFDVFPTTLSSLPTVDTK